MLVGLREKRGLALIFITHDLSLAWSLCDRIAVMYLGRVVEQGEAAAVIERPQHPYTQALVDAVPVRGARRRRPPRAARRRDARPDRHPGRLPLPPALPEALRALRPASIRRCSASSRRARASRAIACLLYERGGREDARRPRPRRRRSELSAGAISPAQSGSSRPGRENAITDVAGIRVGHSQSAAGERSGVTVIEPPRLPARAGTAVVNGTGVLSATLEIDEWGTFETPIYLCGTHAVGTVYQAAIVASGLGPEYVDDPGRRRVRRRPDGRLPQIVAADVEAAQAALAPGPVAEGTVGAGTGMSCFDFPGGIGTASRIAGEWTVGVLLLCNFGDRERLDLLGHRLDPAPPPEKAPDGSCIAVCATDAPLDALALSRLALRPLLGLARAGSYATNGSGEIGLAFSTADADGWPQLRRAHACSSPPPGRRRTRRS